MPRLTRNSLDCGVSNRDSDMSSIRAESSGPSSSISVQPSPPVASSSSRSSHTIGGEMALEVVQAIQGSLAQLVQSAVDARFAASSSSALPTVPGPSIVPNAGPIVSRSNADEAAVPTSIVGASNFVLPSIPHTGIAHSPQASADDMVYNQASSSDATGRIVPSFVSTFSTPTTALVWSSNNISSSPFSALASSSLGGFPSASSYPLTSVGNFIPQSIGPSALPFIVGPGYFPIPAKTVSAIISGKYINLADLLPDNSYVADESNEPQLLLDGRLILTGSSRKQQKELTDIVSWVEAFAIFRMIVCTYFPQRWRDLAAYNLLILRTFRQFRGPAWCNYDRAFRQHAAAVKLTDWSELNVQLFNFYTAASAARPSSSPSRVAAEGKSNVDSSVICSSWNHGRCVAPTPFCRFRHACIKCLADHRVIECPATSNSRSDKNAPIPPKSRRL